MKHPQVPFYSLAAMHQAQRTVLEKAFRETLDSNWFVLGNKLQTFEEEFAQYLGCKYAVGVGNGLEGLQLSLMALGIGQGDEVLVPAHTFAASFLAVLNIGAKPIAIEVDEASCNLDIEQCKELVSPNTKAIMPVHLYGNPCKMDVVLSFAIMYNLWVVEDNAQAVGATHKGKKTGTFGHVNACSFYPSKNLGALGDAGAVTTNDKDIYHKLLQLRNYGSMQKYHHESAGLNSRMDELQAAFLSVKLPMLDQWNLERRRLAINYSTSLAKIEELQLPQTIKNSEAVWHIYAVRTTKRDALHNHLAKRGVQTVIHYPIPPHLQKAFSYLGYQKGDFPITEKIAAETLSLPLYPGLSTEDQQYVIDCVIEFFA